MSAPPIRMRPERGAATRSSKAASVDLPEPDGPSTATLAPCGTSMVKPSNTSGRSGVQPKCTASTRSAVPWGKAAGCAGSGRWAAGWAASSTRVAEAAALPARAPARGKPPAISNAATRRNTAPVTKTGRPAAPSNSSRMAPWAHRNPAAWAIAPRRAKPRWASPALRSRACGPAPACGPRRRTRALRAGRPDRIQHSHPNRAALAAFSTPPESIGHPRGRQRHCESGHGEQEYVA